MNQPIPGPMEQLQLQLETFVNGEDRSLHFAAKIEGLIATGFPDDHPLQELADDFAQYRPNGGDSLYSESEMVPKVRWWLSRLREERL